MIFDIIISICHDIEEFYEAKLCFLCLVGGFCNRSKLDLSRNPQLCYFSLIFFTVLDSTNKYLKHSTAQNCSKHSPICGIRHRIPYLRNPEQFVESTNKYGLVRVNTDIGIDKLSCCGIRNCKWNQQIVSGILILFMDSVYINLSFIYWVVTRKINLNYYIGQLPVEIPNVWSQFRSSQLRSQILSTSISIHYALKISILVWCNTKFWLSLATYCAIWFHALSTLWLQTLNLFGVVFQNTIRWHSSTYLTKVLRLFVDSADND